MVIISVFVLYSNCNDNKEGHSDEGGMGIGKALALLGRITSEGLSTVEDLMGDKKKVGSKVVKDLSGLFAADPNAAAPKLTDKEREVLDKLKEIKSSGASAKEQQEALKDLASSPENSDAMMSLLKAMLPLVLG
uniref:Variable outer membrane protein n=1 Tax=Parastrongyloides trichosuri TaxID=131310 RepID=A0A0N4ZFW4_PARTI